MKKFFCETVESGRQTGPDRLDYVSKRGDRFGLFLLQRPPMRKGLIVLASDGSHWEAMKLPPPAFEHVSVSIIDRCPSWEEMCWVKSLFFEEEETVIEYHPPRSVYVDHHRFTLHLWRPIGIDIPLPPSECV